jgi:hypothetical protein
MGRVDVTKPNVDSGRNRLAQSAAESIYVPKPIRGNFKEVRPLTSVLAHMFYYFPSFLVRHNSCESIEYEALFSIVDRCGDQLEK